MVVLPVPGPPVIRLKLPRAASAQATFCQSVWRTPSTVSAAGNSLARRSESCAGTTEGSPRRAAMAAATARS
ncbi:hypothetical protein D3C80_2004660 [compost metagenome]